MDIHPCQKLQPLVYSTLTLLIYDSMKCQNVIYQLNSIGFTSRNCLNMISNMIGTECITYSFCLLVDKDLEWMALHGQGSFQFARVLSRSAPMHPEPGKVKLFN